MFFEKNSDTSKPTAAAATTAAATTTATTAAAAATGKKQILIQSNTKWVNAVLVAVAENVLFNQLIFLSQKNEI